MVGAVDLELHLPNRSGPLDQLPIEHALECGCVTSGPLPISQLESACRSTPTTPTTERLGCCTQIRGAFGYRTRPRVVRRRRPPLGSEQQGAGGAEGEEDTQGCEEPVVGFSEGGASYGLCESGDLRVADGPNGEHGGRCDGHPTNESRGARHHPADDAGADDKQDGDEKGECWPGGELAGAVGVHGECRVETPRASECPPRMEDGGGGEGEDCNDCTCL